MTVQVVQRAVPCGSGRCRDETCGPAREVQSTVSGHVMAMRQVHVADRSVTTAPEVI